MDEWIPTELCLHRRPGSATALSAPSAVAVNGEGDLYIADFNLGEVIVVPTTTGIALCPQYRERATPASHFAGVDELGNCTSEIRNRR